MNIFNLKLSEISFWQVLVGVALVVLAVLVVKDMVTTNQIVVTPSGNSFVRPCYFGPLSSAQYKKYADAKDASVTKSDSAAAKK